MFIEVVCAFSKLAPASHGLFPYEIALSKGIFCDVGTVIALSSLPKLPFAAISTFSAITVKLLIFPSLSFCVFP